MLYRENKVGPCAQARAPPFPGMAKPARSRAVAWVLGMPLTVMRLGRVPSPPCASLRVANCKIRDRG